MHDEQLHSRPTICFTGNVWLLQIQRLASSQSYSGSKATSWSRMQKARLSAPIFWEPTWKTSYIAANLCSYCAPKRMQTSGTSVADKLRYGNCCWGSIEVCDSDRLDALCLKKGKLYIECQDIHIESAEDLSQSKPPLSASLYLFPARFRNNAWQNCMSITDRVVFSWVTALRIVSYLF